MNLSIKRLLGVGFFILLMTPLWAQNTGEIKGRVVSEKGEPLGAVDIQLGNTEMGTYSDWNGGFSLSAPSGEYQLLISTIGYETSVENIRVEAGGTLVLEIVLVESATLLNTVTLKGGALKPRNRTVTVNTISLSDIKKMNISTPQDLLYQVPGVERIDLGQGGAVSQIGMRGFELGGHGGDLAMEVDGVSFNETEHSGGYVDMNILIPLNLSKMEVYKGPSSVLFGLFARGGALSFETRKGGEYQDISVTGGSYDAFDSQIALGQYFGKEDRLKTNFAAQLVNSRGYMHHSDYLKGNLNGRLAYDLSEQTEIGLTLNAHSSKWDAPGFVTKDMLDDKRERRQRAANAEDDGGNQVFASERLELNHSFNENLRFLAYAYSIQQSNTRFSKFGLEPGPGEQTEVRHSRKTYAFGGSLNGMYLVGTKELDWVAGVEYYNEFTDRTSWMTYNRDRQGMDSYQLNTYRLQSLSVYAQGEWDLNQYFRPSVGLRYETFDGSLKQRLQSSASDLTSLSHASPKLGFRSTLFTGFDFRASVSNGYSLPTGDAKYDPDTDVDAEKLWQYEIGVNYDYKHILHVDVSAYHLKNSNERTYVHSEDLVMNSGKTERSGIEAQILFSPFQRFNLKGNFTYQTTKIVDHDDLALKGKELTNLPQTITSIAADYTFASGLGLMANLRDSGKYATNRINTDYYKGYTVVDSEIFYNFTSGAQKRGRIFLKVNNVFDTNYATYALDFESEFGIPGGVFYAPAPMRNYTVGVSYTIF